MGRGICALVPMRHVSERVPGKNYRPFAGKPLFHHVVETLLTVSAIDRVVIDTDSPTVREQAEDRFPSVDVVDRPRHLLGDLVPMTDVVRHDASLIDEPWILQTHSTNPLLRAATIDRAIEDLLSALDRYDSLLSVTRLQTRLYDADGRAINHDPEVLLRTQDLPPVYEENSNLYVFPRALVLEDGKRIGRRPLLFEMDRIEATDIDTEADFVLAEALQRLGAAEG